MWGKSRPMAGPLVPPPILMARCSTPSGFSLAKSMRPGLCLLLCLGLCLGQNRRSPERINRPVLSVEPSRVAQRGSFVALQCSAPVQAIRFRMQKEGVLSSQVEKAPNSFFFWNQASFFIDYISESSAGPYTCCYLYKASWSQPSLPVELVVTGLYPRPFFWAKPGQVVARGRSVDLLCQSQLGLPHFAVVKERRALLRMNSSSSLASFRIQAMTKNHVGTYYCYGYSPLSPFLWSHPSKALMLEMTDAAISPTIFSLAQLSLVGLSLLFFGRLGIKTLARWWSRRKQPGLGEAPA